MKVVRYYIILIAVLFSCKKPEDRSCWKATGRTTRVDRVLNDFDQLRLFDGFEYHLVQDSLDFVSITGGENLLPFVETNVSNSVLTIQNNNRCNFLRDLPADLSVEIHFSNLNSVYNESYNTIDGSIRHPEGYFQWDNWNGATQINLQLDLDTAQFALHTGAPSLVASGHANMLWLFTSGYCHIDGTDLITKDGQAHNVGIGDIRIHVEGDWLNCVVESFGNVYYTGSYEQIHKEDTGEGSIIEF